MTQAKSKFLSEWLHYCIFTHLSWHNSSDCFLSFTHYRRKIFRVSNFLFLHSPSWIGMLEELTLLIMIKKSASHLKQLFVMLSKETENSKRTIQKLFKTDFEEKSLWTRAWNCICTLLVASYFSINIFEVCVSISILCAILL